MPDNLKSPPSGQELDNTCTLSLDARSSSSHANIDSIFVKQIGIADAKCRLQKRFLGTRSGESDVERQ
eukprot:8014985-Pyramimonas_sp.AAC.2